MNVSYSFGTASRLCALLMFFAYLIAGASLALPSETRCFRCARLSSTGTITPGASCPLSYNGQHCHHGHEKTSGKITLCSDGCLRYDGQGGEIPSLAKFLSVLSGPSLTWIPTGATIEVTPLTVEDLFFPPLQHPPPVLS